MNFQNTLIDNSENLKLVDTLKELIQNPAITKIKIATGYWDLPGMTLLANEISDFLKRDGTNLKILIGKDPYLYASQVSKPKYQSKEYPDDFIRVDLDELEVKTEYQMAVEILIDFIEKQNPDGSPKLEIHKFRKNENDENQFLHSKCYIFMGETESYGIIGSSNFTEKGLEGNAELNWYTNHSQDVTAEPKFGSPSKGHNFWFEEKWQLSQNWSKEFLEQIIKPSTIGQETLKQIQTEKTNKDNKSTLKILPPYEAYIKVLIDQFGSVINSDCLIKEEDYLPQDENFKILKYQTEAVNQGFAIMKKHGGFILADVVGLGKTFTAVMIIKRYLLSIGFSKPVLVITPPAIKKSWEDSIKYFDKNAKQKIEDHITITTIGCLDTNDVTDDKGDHINSDDFDDNFKENNFGLVVIDESHRFRNSETQMYQKLDDLIADVKPYVVLLSATPQNNRPNDLANQIYLFQRERRSSTLAGLGEFGNNLESFFADKEKIYEECIKDYKGRDVDGRKIPKSSEEKEADLKMLNQITNDLRDYIVNQLVIRRTRTDLKKYYADDMKTQNLIFPEIAPPKGIPYEMNGELGSLFIHSLDVIAPNIAHIDWDENGVQSFDFRDIEKDCIGYYRYRAIEYLKSPEHQKIYAYDSKRERKGSGTISVEGISARLAAMMEMHLVKRLESSRDAFEESLHNLKNNIQNMLDMIAADRIFICPDVDVNAVLSEDNRNKKGGFQQCLNELAIKAEKQNTRHQTTRNREFKTKDFSTDYKTKLENDLRLTNELIEGWKNIKSDPKIATFIRKIDTFMDKTKNKNQKLVIFTECIATQKALVNKFEECASEYKILSITAENRHEMQEIIEQNFDANYKGEKKNDYNILITTDVLSEGINLHEANSLLNYDSPWNATRLMQRLGRINRIGSTSPKIYSYNFYPSTKGDEQINLYKRTLVKLQSFHNLFGEDSQIYTVDENLVEHELVQYDTEDTESANMKFIAELKDFNKNNPEKFAELKAISEPIFSAVAKSENSQQTGFVVLHKNDNDGKYVDSILYKTNGEKSLPITQTEFVQTLKDVCELPFENLSNSEYERFSSNVLSAFNLELLNEGIKIKSRFQAGEKESKEAKLKVRNLYKTFADYIDDELSKKIDTIIDSIGNKNHTLIRKVNETPTNNLLFVGAEAIIDEWHKLCYSKNTEYTGKSIVTFVIK